MKTKALTFELLYGIDAYWHAANYLSVGQIYLFNYPLLKRPLTLADAKNTLPGHWGTTPGQNVIYVRLNQVIHKCDLDIIYVSGSAHGGRAVVAKTISRACTARSIPTSARMRPHCRHSFVSPPFREAFPATHRRRAVASRR